MKKLNYLKNESGCKTNEALINFILKNPKHPIKINEF